MKRAVAIIAEFLLFIFVFLAGSLLTAIPSAHLPVWTVDLSPKRYFVLDGLLLMLVIYLVFIAIGAARRRLGSVAVTSTTALVLAFALGLAMKFGFVTR
ncbi:MAG TPA: hypothetical protein VLI45_06210 [Acidobacteriaceae bacterium]|nr:hypothetical protein [Acidobacteriaceae bacterium]